MAAIKSVEEVKLPENDDDSNSKRDTLEKIIEEDEQVQAASSNKTTGASLAAVKSENSNVFRPPLAPLKPNELPAKGPETQEFLFELREQKENFRSIQNTLVQLTGTESNIIEINKKSNKAGQLDLMRPAEELCDEAYTITEKNYRFVPVEMDGSIEDELGEEAEEEDVEEEDDELEDPEEEEEDDEEKAYDPAMKDKKNKFGETNHYCPVSFKTNGILVPGNNEIQLKYREKIYRFVSEEAKALFFENPENYLPKKNERFKVILIIYFKDSSFLLQFIN